MTDETPKILLVHSALPHTQDLAVALQADAYNLVSSIGIKPALEQLMETPKTFQAVIIEAAVFNEENLKLLGQLRNVEFLNPIPFFLLAPPKATAANTPIEVKEGQAIQATTASQPPPDSETLISILKAIIQVQSYQKMITPTIIPTAEMANILTSGKFHFRKLQEGNQLANFLAQACPNPRLAALGIGEIFINAVEHGNLSIHYEDKSKLQSQALWLDEVDRRLSLPENKDKYVEVAFTRTEQELHITVKDQGKGFDWRKYQVLDPRRMLHSHGRGIAMARSLAFQHLEYSETGNEVTCVISLAPPPEEEPAAP